MSAQSTRPFAISGVVEGFYGPPYTFPQRDDLIAFLGRHGCTSYLYGPKNDRQHRSRWREPYPATTMAQFGRTIAAAGAAGVRFGYALSPSPSIVFADESDFGLIAAKLGAFYNLGVRDFGLFFDDIEPALHHDADRAAYPSVAAAHAELGNRLFAWLRARDPACTLTLCPTDYHGGPPFSPYLHELGARLDPAIDLLYTGSEVCAATIGAADAAAFGAAVGRPPLIWDNYPVNDLAMQPELHLGPIRGRDPALHTAVRGILVNPMLQAEASKLPLRTWADYLADPRGYDPERSWAAAIVELAGRDSAWALHLLAACALGSCLSGPMAPRMDALTTAVIAGLARDEPAATSPAARELDAYLVELDEACYHLKNRMANLALRAELLPWIDLLETKAELGRRSLAALGGARREAGRLRELRAAAANHHKRIGGEAILELSAMAER